MPQSNPIKVSAISYLNTIPFVYGLQSKFLGTDEINISLDIPSVCAQKLLTNQVDIGIVPVAILPQMKEYFIVTDYCIGATDEVKSVMLFSEVPLHEIKTIYLDYQSRTSVMLARILAEKYWKINPTWLAAKEGYEQNIVDETAGVIIGDRALVLYNKFQYKYDLASEWKKLTTLPFVFACWVANKKLPVQFIEKFNDAIRFGVSNIEQAIAKYADEINGYINRYEYLTKNVSYVLDEEKQKGMELFLRYADEIQKT